VQSFLRYNHGLDEELELIALGTDLGVISKRGSWLSLPDVEGEPKAQGDERLRQLLIEHPEYAEHIKQQIMEMM
jgi:hypothetical protein